MSTTKEKYFKSDAKVAIPLASISKSDPRKAFFRFLLHNGLFSFLLLAINLLSLVPAYCQEWQTSMPFNFTDSAGNAWSGSASSIDVGGGPNRGPTYSLSGAITPAFVWQADDGPNSPPVDQLNTQLYFPMTFDVWAWAEGPQQPPAPSFSVLDGFSDDSATTGYMGDSITGSHLIQTAVAESPAGTYTAVGAPIPMSGSATDNFQGAGVGSVATVSATSSPIYMSLNGVTQDDLNPSQMDIMVGQQCQAGIVNLPTLPFGWYYTYSWTVTGTTFQSWVGTGTSSYFDPGPDCTANSTYNWYWNEPTNDVSRWVDCIVTATPPFWSSATPWLLSFTQNVTVFTPIVVSSSVAISTVVVLDNPNFDYPNGQPVTGWWLEACTAQGGPGMEINEKIAAPFLSPWYEANPPEPGMIAVCQVLDDCWRSSSSEGAVDRGAGLDTAYPAGGVAYGAPLWENPYSDIDAPGVSLNYPTDSNAAFNDSFTDFVMYKPPSSNTPTCEVPIGSFNWQALGGAQFEGNPGAWVGSGEVLSASTSPVLTTSWPSWAQIIQ